MPAVLATVVGGARIIAYFVGLLIVCLYCEVIGRVWCLWLTPKDSGTRVQRANLVTRHWHVVLTELTLRVLGARLEARGKVPAGRYVVIANHQSLADIAILPWALRSLNVKFVAKEELGRGIPTISMALNHWGSALISREATRKDLAQIRSMARRLAHWEGSVVVFPEGTRSRSGRLLPYRSAVVRIVAKETGLPLLPVAIDGTHVAPDLLSFARHMLGARGTITVGEPVPVAALSGRLDAVLEEIRAWTSKTLDEGRHDGSVPRPPGWAELTPQQVADGDQAPG
jgi:1-acyl-sn-glycerol-3-phosphate acyltransferase